VGDQGQHRLHRLEPNNPCVRHDKDLSNEKAIKVLNAAHCADQQDRRSRLNVRNLALAVSVQMPSLTKEDSNGYNSRFPSRDGFTYRE
jgi:hypothetical protein